MSEPEKTPATPPPPPAPAAVTQPPAPSLPAAGDVDEWQPTKAPEGWNQGAWDSYQKGRFTTKRLKAENAALLAQQQAAESARATAVREAAEAKAAAEQAAAKITQTRTEYEQKLTMREIGGNFQHASVQSLARRMYAEYASTTDKPEPFGAWLTSDAVKSDPVIGVHFPKAEPVVPEETWDDPAPTFQTYYDAEGNPVLQVPAPGRVGTGGGNPAPAQKWDEGRINRLRGQGLWRTGRVDTETGKPIGGSAAWQQWVRDTSR